MSFIGDNDVTVQEEVKPEKPEQVIVRGNLESHLWKKHKDDKTLLEIYNSFKTWEPQREIWVYKYGPTVLGISSSMSATYINYYFRETLFLLKYTRLTSYAIMFLAPGVTAGCVHYWFVTRQILQHKRPGTQCPMCLQVKAMALQGLCSIGYPLILVPVLCYPIAKRLKNYSVPALTVRNTFPIIQFTKDMLKPIRGQLWASAAVQIVLGAGMAYVAQNNYDLIVKPKLDKIKTVFSPRDPRDLAKKYSNSQANE